MQWSWQDQPLTGILHQDWYFSTEVRVYYKYRLAAVFKGFPSSSISNFDKRRSIIGCGGLEILKHLRIARRL